MSTTSGCNQPWRVDKRTRGMVQANIRAVAEHAAQAGVDILGITWVLPCRNSEFARSLIRAMVCPACPRLQAATGTRVPASVRRLGRLGRRARLLSRFGDACRHGRRFGDAIAGQEEARGDHRRDEGAAPPDGVR
jgi:hypothetical protein